MGETEGAESVAVDAVADPVGSAWSTLGNLRAFRRPRSASAATMRLWTTSPAGGAARRVLRQLALQRLDAPLVIHEARDRQIGLIDFGDRVELEPRVYLSFVSETSAFKLEISAFMPDISVFMPEISDWICLTCESICAISARITRKCSSTRFVGSYGVCAIRSLLA